MNRPTYKELDKKLTEARNAADLGYVSLINPEAVASDAIELGYHIEDDLLGVLASVLDGTTPKHYAGKRPPARSYENKITASDLYAFRTESGRFNCVIYLKFTMFNNDLWIISFHKNRDDNKGRR